MNCPFCDNPMEKGNTYGTGAYVENFTYWLPEGVRPSFPIFPGDLEEVGGFKLKEAHFSLAKLPTYICRKCKKGVIDFAD